MANIVKTGSSESAGDNTSPHKPVGLEARYDELVPVREPFLKRARDAAKLTIPSLLPPAGHTQLSDLYQPWQSVGSRGVNNLASKILLALLPPNTPFFRFVISQMELERLTKKPELKTELEEGLSKYEKEIMVEIETGTTRVSSFEAILHLIVAGNALTHLPPKGGMKVYHLDSFVVVRDGMGNVLEIIAEERLSPKTLPQNMRELVSERCKDHEKTVRLHTCVQREGNRFITYQEVKGIEVPGSRGSYPLDSCPFIPLRWVKIDGEDYGRGHVEGLHGDLRSVEGLSQSIVEGSAAAAKLLILVNPNGVTKLKTVAEAPNGAIRSGKADDVSVVQSEKSVDLRIAKETRSEMKGDLEAAFLLAGSIQRNAERVTAEEIRLMAGELEDALGGVYSLLAQEFQLPLVNRLIAQMVKQKRLKPLPKGIVRPTIVTGLEALSRGHDLQRLDLFMAGVEKYGPEKIDEYVDLSDLFTRRATALGLDQKGLIRSKADVQARQQQKQMQSLVQSAAPQGIKAMSDMATKGMNPNAAQGEDAAA